MTPHQKQTLLEQARTHVVHIRETIHGTRATTASSINQMSADARSMSREDQMNTEILSRHLAEQIQQLEQLYSSPYFVRCDVQPEGTTESTPYYFSKFQFSQESIYSWIAPAAALRFENPGPVSYTRPDGNMERSNLVRKDQYMIIDGVITFLSTESAHHSRELIYQKDFTARKTGFILPEIVEQMEKAQDQVIRADHRGSFVISGPAGSGKTTLALHRIAYLMLSPDTASLFPSSRMIIFVQDNGTKEYFSHLLPELGIKGVTITTFTEWALEVLHLANITSVAHYGKNEDEKEYYEYEKICALKNTPLPSHTRFPFTFLDELYSATLSHHSKKILIKQKKERILDTIDLTALLTAYQNQAGLIDIYQEYFIQQKDGTLKQKFGRLPAKYAVLLVDEFQNYLPQQIELFKSCLMTPSQGLLYVGDLAQQIQFGTIRAWSEVGENISPDRNVVLAKVYRNTKNILAYIKNLGYGVSIPGEMREGPEVCERILTSTAEEIDYIHTIRTAHPGATIGVLTKESSYLIQFHEAFKNDERIYVKTMREAQGVEFDIVCLVGITANLFSQTNTGELSQEFHEERMRIHQDLLYIALTRAMDELHIVGNTSLQDVLREIKN